MFLFPGGSGKGYQIANSLRLRSAASAYLNRTFGSPTSATSWSFSCWLKLGALGITRNILDAEDGSTNFRTQMYISSSDSIIIVSVDSGTTNLLAGTSSVFRDPSAWYHILFVWDTNNGTANQRVRLFVNGVQLSLNWTTTPSSGYAGRWNKSAVVGWIGKSSIAGEYLDGYLSEVNFIDGQALTPSSFGTTNSDGVWTPKKYTGTYGNNGFYLPFSNGSSTTTLGYDYQTADRSGTKNDWTCTNISLTAGVTYDWMTDTPTNNYATLNPIVPSAANITYANLRSGTTAVQGTQELTQFGGSYWEVTAGGSAPTCGVISGTGTTNTTTVTANKTFGFRLTAAGALDYINITDAGSWTSITTGLTANQFPYGVTQAADWNFGQRPFTGTASGKALCTANLPAVAITAPKKHFDVATYTGNGGTLDITSTQFQPDFAWVKSRSLGNSHVLVNAVVGANAFMNSNNTNAETTLSTVVNSFLTNGIRLGSEGTLNTNLSTGVSWLWKASGTGSSNTSGSITSTVSANPTAGFSIVTYTGTGANATVGHGLGVAPAMIIVKQRTAASTTNWKVYHARLTSAAYYVDVNTTAAQISDSTVWQSTSPSSTVFSVGTHGAVNVGSGTYVAYCFAEIPGFSKFGSYTGNGSTDGPFVYCGFRPKYVLIKNASSVIDWVIMDAVRDTYNIMGNELLPDSNIAEATGQADLDFTANGFKLRRGSTFANGNTNTIIFAAFAESPFGGSNVSPAPAR